MEKAYQIREEKTKTNGQKKKNLSSRSFNQEMHLWRLSMINNAYLYLRPWNTPELFARLSQSC